MTNWCFNRVDIQGPCRSVEAAVMRLRGSGYVEWEFQASTLRVPADGADPGALAWTPGALQRSKREDLGVVVRAPLWRPFDFTRIAPVPEDVAARGFHAAAYRWALRNHGTKWNAGANPGEERTEPAFWRSSTGRILRASWRFDTAWSPPVPAAAKLSEQFPDCAVTLSWSADDEKSRYVFRQGVDAKRQAQVERTIEIMDLVFSRLEADEERDAVAEGYGRVPLSPPWDGYETRDSGALMERVRHVHGDLARTVCAVRALPGTPGEIPVERAGWRIHLLAPLWRLDGGAGFRLAVFGPFGDADRARRAAEHVAAEAGQGRDADALPDGLQPTADDFEAAEAEWRLSQNVEALTAHQRALLHGYARRRLGLEPAP